MEFFVCLSFLALRVGEEAPYAEWVREFSVEGGENVEL